MRGLKGVLAAAEKLCIDAVSLSADVTLFFLAFVQAQCI